MEPPHAVSQRPGDRPAAGNASNQNLKPVPIPSERTLERDDFSSNRHPAHLFDLSMIFSENRYPLFRIML
jgi:hypothetical protein